MQPRGIRVSKYYELKYHVVGNFISFSCYLIGWFMPFYFAGRLENGNVCEYFPQKLRTHRMLPVFEKIFAWGNNCSLNDVDIDAKCSLAESTAYCRKHYG